MLRAAKKNLFLQNLLFYYDCESAVRPSGLIFLEGSYCERTNCSPSLLQQTPNVRIVTKDEKQVLYPLLLLF